VRIVVRTIFCVGGVGFLCVCCWVADTVISHGADDCNLNANGLSC